VTVAERKIRRTQDPRTGLWFEWFEPTFDPEDVRRLAELHPMTEQERVAAGIRYALAAYDRGRAAAWARWLSR
jgi:hypothetical protein